MENLSEPEVVTNMIQRLNENLIQSNLQIHVERPPNVQLAEQLYRNTGNDIYSLLAHSLKLLPHEKQICIIHLYTQNEVVSSILIYVSSLKSGGYIAKEHSYTIPNYRRMGLNMILRCVFVLLSGYIIPKVQYIGSEATNPSVYAYMKIGFQPANMKIQPDYKKIMKMDRRVSEELFGTNLSDHIGQTVTNPNLVKSQKMLHLKSTYGPLIENIVFRQYNEDHDLIEVVFAPNEYLEDVTVFSVVEPEMYKRARDVLKFEIRKLLVTASM